MAQVEVYGVDTELVPLRETLYSIQMKLVANSVTLLVAIICSMSATISQIHRAASPNAHSFALEIEKSSFFHAADAFLTFSISWVAASVLCYVRLNASHVESIFPLSE